MDYLDRLNETDTKSELEALLELLQEARAENTAFKEAQAKCLERLYQDPEYLELTQGRERWQEAVTKLENELRDKGLKAHLQGQTLPQGLTTKNFTVVKVLDPAQAREWCLKNFPAVLVVDNKAFESVAKMKLANIPAEIATVEQEPRVQITSDLSAYGGQDA